MNWQWLKNLISRPSFPVAVIVLFALTYSALGVSHKMGNYGVETDFYGLYALDVQRLLDGEMVQERDHAPGYTVLVSALSLLTGDIFTAGKILSVLSAIGLIWIFYRLVHHVFDRKLALTALVLLAVMLLPVAFIVGLDIVFTFFFVAAIYLYFRDDGENGRWLILSGVLSGLTYLIRYNGILLPMGVVAIALFLNPNGMDFRGKIRHLALYFGVFIAVILPWVSYLTFFDPGGVTSPGLNVAIAYEFYGQGGEFGGDQRAIFETRFDSLMSIVLYDLNHFVSHYVRNIFNRFERFAVSAFPFPGYYFLLPGALFFLTNASKRQYSLLIFPLLGFLVLCLVNYLTRYYLFIAPFAVIFVAYFFTLSFSNNKYFPRLSLNIVKWPVFALVLVFLLKSSITVARNEINSEPRHLNELAKLISADAGEAKIMARKPHLAYLAKMKFENYPMANSIPEMMESVNQLKCKYVYFGSQELRYRPELKQLLKPETVSEYLIPVYEDSNNGIFLYQTKW